MTLTPEAACIERLARALEKTLDDIERIPTSYGMEYSTQEARAALAVAKRLLNNRKEDR